MTDDTSAGNVPVPEWDPLTAPVWEISGETAATLAPDIEEFMPTAADTIVRRKPTLPPDADEIIRGEYTGWIPLIKPGESLADAKAREEKRELYTHSADFNIDATSEDDEKADQNFDPGSRMPVDVDATGLSSPDNLGSDFVSALRDPIIEVRPFNFATEIVADPDFVVSPAEALEEARRRIAQMRASLQTNINRVAQSFEHQIFTTADDEPDVTAKSSSFESLFETESAESVFAQSAYEPKETSGPPANAQEPLRTEASSTEALSTQTLHEPRVYTQSTQRGPSTVIIDEAADQTHSLELVIMRDEIKDLRDRLDSSQKLVENLMVRLADLAELALKRGD